MNPVGLETSKPNTNDIHGKLWLAKHHFIKNHLVAPKQKKSATLPETNSLHLKWIGWKTNVSFNPIFMGGRC